MSRNDPTHGFKTIIMIESPVHLLEKSPVHLEKCRYLGQFLGGWPIGQLWSDFDDFYSFGKLLKK